MTRDQIYQGLELRRHELMRRDSTPRVTRELGIDFLLDQLIAIQREEEFDQVFGGTDDTRTFSTLG